VENGAMPAGEAPAAGDPYSDPYGAGAADRYQTPGADYGSPSAQQAPPANAPPESYPAPPANAYAPESAYPAPESTPGAYPPGDVTYPPENGLPGSAPPAGAAPGGDFARALEAAQRELEAGQMADALRQLSQWYGHPQLAPAEQQTLNQLLDQVAGTVVYSTQNLLEPPYEVQPGEKLEDIGDKYNVPWKLLAKINGIDDPAALRPGERLKVVRGPFQAVVSLEKREMTLMTADGSYAGRFKIGIGAEHPPQEGTFPVSEKVVNPVYYGRDRAIGAEDAANPLGERWIGLGKNMGIHGTNNPEGIGRNDLPGYISLSQRDIEDVYDILSLGSRVTIRR
jgi:lipoprotein-anchoring transpeptidase ErfK/SrfK